MTLLLQYAAIGLVAAFAIAAPVGYGLARLLAIEPPWRRTASRGEDFAPPILPGPSVLVANLGPDIGQSIAHLCRDLDQTGIVLLRMGDHGKQIGFLMSVDQYELMHATERLAKDPDHLMSLTGARPSTHGEPELSWRSVLA
jgi:hypothetical protein